MRHAPITFAEQLETRNRRPAPQPPNWDLLFCTDMLNLAEFIGLVPAAIRDLPRCVLFHENQLTYPNQNRDQRDLHFAFSNITTALAADKVWFNSHFHMNEFLTAATNLVRRMPDFRPSTAIETIANKSSVQRLGIETIDRPRPPKQDDAIDILWAARWEHDKNPEIFFDAIRLLNRTGTPFRLHVLGESFRNVPPIFAVAKQEFANQIASWGYAESRHEYVDVLGRADVIVSTAYHEFLGLSVLEAMSLGVVPLLPNRLSYPELLSVNDYAALSACLYDGTGRTLAERLAEFQRSLGSKVWAERQRLSRTSSERFAWRNVGPTLDKALADCANHPS